MFLEKKTNYLYERYQFIDYMKFHIDYTIIRLL